MLLGHLRREHGLLHPTGTDAAQHGAESGSEAEAGGLTAITSPTHFAGLV